MKESLTLRRRVGEAVRIEVGGVSATVLVRGWSHGQVVLSVHAPGSPVNRLDRFGVVQGLDHALEQLDTAVRVQGRLTTPGQPG